MQALQEGSCTAESGTGADTVDSVDVSGGTLGSVTEETCWEEGVAGPKLQQRAMVENGWTQTRM